MKIAELMTTEVQVASPTQTICDAAKMMASLDAGILPVADKDKLVGMISDRDIAIRGVGKGLDHDAKVRNVMSQEVKYCFEDEEADHVARNMADIKVRRLPVMNRDKRLVGIVSLADIALSEGPHKAGTAVAGISEPGGAHSQTIDGHR